MTFNLSDKAQYVNSKLGLKFYAQEDVQECFKRVEIAIAKFNGKNMADIDKEIDELFGDDFR